MRQMNINLEIKNQVFRLYKNVKYLREKNGLTTKELAEIIGISEKKLIQAEDCTNYGFFYDTHIKNICTYFKVSADLLFEESLY